LFEQESLATVDSSSEMQEESMRLPGMPGLKLSFSELTSPLSTDYSLMSFPASPSADPLDDIVSGESMSPERLVYRNQEVNKVDEGGMVYVGIPPDKISKKFVETVKSRAMYLGL
jgi:hypothetical protein